MHAETIPRYIFSFSRTSPTVGIRIVNLGTIFILLVNNNEHDNGVGSNELSEFGVIRFLIRCKNL